MSDQLFRASDFANDGKYHILVAATGSVATIKLPLIVAALSEDPKISIRIILSTSATSFLQGQSSEQPAISQLRRQAENLEAIYQDSDEWTKPWTRGDPILHIELRRWADVLVIAPLSANSLAGITGGFSNNLILSVVRAWDSSGLVDGKNKKILVAPAMNTAMWHQPITARQIDVLQTEWKWFRVLRPIEKLLACGDVGDGAMMDWKEIVRIIRDHKQENLSKETNQAPS